MKRQTRALLAKQTVEICEAGFYISPGGRRVTIASELERAKLGTVLYSPENPVPSQGSQVKGSTRFAAKNETAFLGLSRLAASGTHVACLNFASAKNPGGGFLNGSSAQEEALARSSGLYPCLLTAPQYYERNRANHSALYLDTTIFSPHVPFFRDDEGTLLETPVLASVITSPAPNAGAIAQNEPQNIQQIEPTMRRRAEMVLGIARAHQVDKLVLGAWGCGVFRNDPRIVAGTFADLLKPPGPFERAFSEVLFSVFDHSEDQSIYRPFAEHFNGGNS